MPSHCHWWWWCPPPLLPSSSSALQHSLPTLTGIAKSYFENCKSFNACKIMDLHITYATNTLPHRAELRKLATTQPPHSQRGLKQCTKYDRRASAQEPSTYSVESFHGTFIFPIGFSPQIPRLRNSMSSACLLILFFGHKYN